MKELEKVRKGKREEETEGANGKKRTPRVKVNVAS